MKRLIIPKDDTNAVPVLIYDCTLPLLERPQKAKFFPNSMQASNHLGIPPKIFFRKRGKGTVFSPSLNKTVAIRIATANQIALHNPINKHCHEQNI